MSQKPERIWKRPNPGINTKFRKNPISGYRVVTCGQTERHAHVLKLIRVWAFLKLFVANGPRNGSRDSVVGIATGYGLDDRGVGVRVPV
jgi:hypothetical protein